MIPNTVTANTVSASICFYLLMGSGSKRLVPGFITNYFGGLLVGLVGASSALTLARLHSALTPCRVLIRNRLRAISEPAGDFDGGGGGLRVWCGGGCHPHTKKAETEGIAIVEYLYRIGRERRAKLYMYF